MSRKGKQRAGSSLPVSPVPSAITKAESYGQIKMAGSFNCVKIKREAIVSEWTSTVVSHVHYCILLRYIYLHRIANEIYYLPVSKETQSTDNPYW
jgi:hypothetical protein